MRQKEEAELRRSRTEWMVRAGRAEADVVQLLSGHVRMKTRAEKAEAKLARLRKLCTEGGTISGGLEELTGWINRVIEAGQEEE